VAGFRLDTKLRGFEVATKRFQDAVATIDGKTMKGLEQAALLAEREIVKGLKSGRPGGVRMKKLSKITKILTGRSKPLNRSGAGGLSGAITHKIDRNNRQAFVGVLRTSRGSDGESLVNIALIHEFGTKPYVIKVTDKMRKFFFFLHFKSGGKINFISPLQGFVLHPGVPARPFIRPVMAKIQPKIQKIVKAALSQSGGPI